MALELCDCVFLYGFVRNWYGYMTYHYHDDYVPKPSQAKRDSSEFPLIRSLMAQHPDRLIYVHPCIVGKCAVGGTSRYFASYWVACPLEEQLAL
eukprot:9478345-Pyramimonas_sp.AAC.4